MNPNSPKESNVRKQSERLVTSEESVNMGKNPRNIIENVRKGSHSRMVKSTIVVYIEENKTQQTLQEASVGMLLVKNEK